MTRRTPAKGLILLLALGLAVPGVWRGKGMADEMTELRTLCIGRYLVDVPAGLELLELYGNVNAVQISRLESGGTRDLERVFNARVAALRDGRADFQGVPLIYKDHRVVGNVRVVAHRADTSALGTTFEDWTEEAYVVNDGAMFRLESVIEPQTADIEQGALIEIARAVRPRADTDVPRGEGACVPGAFVAVPQMSEAAGATVGLVTEQGALGWQFSFAQRAPYHLPLEVDTRFNNPTAEDIEIAGYPGQQLLLQHTFVNFGATAGQSSTPDAWGHLFRVEYYDQRDDPFAGPMTPDQAREVWQRVLQSIRPKG